MSRLFILLAFVCVLTSCNNENDAEKTQDQTSSPGEGAELKQETYEETLACLQDPFHICESGIQSASLQDYLADVMIEPLNVAQLGDSLDEGNGYVWLVRTLHMDKGKVYIEGNFIDERKADEEEINSSRVNRIRIESPQFYTQEGLTVGKTLGDLLEVYSDSAFYLVSQPDYGVLDLSRFNSHIHFLVELDSARMEALESEASPLSKVPSSQAIRSIVIM